MAKYAVDLPFAGYLIVYVEADSKESAIEAALAGADAKIIGEGDTQCGEWETLRAITRGNVCNAPLNDARAEIIDDV